MVAARAGLCLLLLTTGCVPSPAGPAGLATTLLWTVRATDGRFLGSATAIGPRQLLTNAHVVAREAVVLVRPGDAATAEPELRVTAITRVHATDAALLALPAPIASPTLRPAPAPIVGAGLTVAGAVAGVPRHGTGTAAAAGAADRFGAGLAAAHLPAAPGFSGGPILDAEGRLVGIVAAAVADSPEAARRLSATGGDQRLVPSLVLYVPLAVALRDAELNAPE